MRKLTREEMNDDYARLRRLVDGDDQFMSGYRIAKIRTREREIPEWTLNDKEVQKVLLRAFPAQHKNFIAKQRADTWARIIYLYFRMQMSASGVAREVQMTTKNVELAVARIRRVARGHRADNRGPRGLRRPGRPRAYAPPAHAQSKRTQTPSHRRVLVEGSLNSYVK